MISNTEVTLTTLLIRNYIQLPNASIFIENTAINKNNFKLILFFHYKVIFTAARVKHKYL